MHYGVFQSSTSDLARLGLVGATHLAALPLGVTGWGGTLPTAKARGPVPPAFSQPVHPSLELHHRLAQLGSQPAPNRGAHHYAQAAGEPARQQQRRALPGLPARQVACGVPRHHVAGVLDAHGQFPSAVTSLACAGAVVDVSI
jgi:hypothetical protein